MAAAAVLFARSTSRPRLGRFCLQFNHLPLASVFFQDFESSLVATEVVLGPLDRLLFRTQLFRRTEALLDQVAEVIELSFCIFKL